MLLVYEGFLPPLLSVLPPGQNRILPGGQKQKQGGQKIFSRPSAVILPPLIFFLPPLIFFFAPAQINPAHATAYNSKLLIHSIQDRIFYHILFSEFNLIIYRQSFLSFSNHIIQFIPKIIIWTSVKPQ